MQTKRALMIMGSALALVSACGDDDDDGPIPALSVSDQSASGAGDVVTIQTLTSTEAGFVVIVQAVDDQPTAPAIGVRAIDAGDHTDVEIALERPAVDGESLYARLHVDANGNGVYEWTPGEALDPIVAVDGDDVKAEFTVTSTQPTIPVVLADDQPVTVDGNDKLLIVKSAITSTTGFVLIKAKPAGSETMSVGFAPLEAGLNAMVEVTVSSTTAPTAGTALEASLVVDTDGDGEYDPAVDEALIVDGEPVSVDFMISGVSTQ